MSRIAMSSNVSSTTASDPASGTGTFQVRGMTCGHCERAVTEEVSRIEGVQSVTVDLSTGQVSITSTRPIERAALAAAVDEAGYTLVG